jgi:MPBQ/MSBQ methyltransferase
MITLNNTWTKVQNHYHLQNLSETIFTALKATGKDPQRLEPADLAPVDEFHIRGRRATVELAEKINLDSSKYVLDLGSGVGGASRYLAATYGCRVTGLDLTVAYVNTAQILAERTGLSGLVDYRQGSALEMPFGDHTFDVVWTQHVGMNIADKPRLYSEIRRVLKPSGQLALYDILAGTAIPIHFPVPWATTQETSFLIEPDRLRDVLISCGFTIGSWRDTTKAGQVFFNELAARIEKNGPPPVGIHLLMGANARDKVRNTARNLNENRIVVFEVVARAA